MKSHMVNFTENRKERDKPQEFDSMTKMRFSFVYQYIYAGKPLMRKKGSFAKIINAWRKVGTPITRLDAYFLGQIMEKVNPSDLSLWGANGIIGVYSGDSLIGFVPQKIRKDKEFEAWGRSLEKDLIYRVPAKPVPPQKRLPERREIVLSENTAKSRFGAIQRQTEHGQELLSKRTRGGLEVHHKQPKGVTS